MTKNVPVTFHNLKGYESHLIMQKIGKFDVKIRVIRNGLEQYVTFAINKNLVFIDSTEFMNSSLNALIKNLSDNDFKYLSQEFTSEQLKLIKHRRVYPYEYMDSFEKFSDRKLADTCELFSSLKDECISEKYYLYAISVWSNLKKKTMSDYHDLYLKIDFLLLPAIFEMFINACLDSYRLDPCHYFSSQGLSWDAMLKMTEIKLQLISDIDRYLFIEKGMRRGISYIPKKLSRANNKYKKSQDHKKLSRCILHI